VAVRARWSYHITAKDDQLTCVLIEKFVIPRDMGEWTTFIPLKCYRCGNDFFIDPAWIKRGMKMKSIEIDGVRVKPVCTDCKNEEGFIFYGFSPYHVDMLGQDLAISKIVNDRGENVTDKMSAKTVHDSLIGEDRTIQIQCRVCHRNDIDLVPMKQETYMDQHHFDSEMSGRRQ
jgi:ribosomal protein S27E